MTPEFWATMSPEQQQFYMQALQAQQAGQPAPVAAPVQPANPW
jgi:hypothetical protein